MQPTRSGSHVRSAAVATASGGSTKSSGSQDAHADGAAVDAALRFAERRRIGPFADADADPRQREKWLAAMVRAGHGFGLAREIARLSPGAEIDLDLLRERSGTVEL